MSTSAGGLTDHWDALAPVLARFPVSRYMGSKRRLLGFIAEVVGQLECESALDAFSGGGYVSYLFKALGMSVTSNDFLAYSYRIAQSAVENSSVRLDDDEVDALCERTPATPTFVQDTFNGLFFTPTDNLFLDTVWGNLAGISDEYKKAIALAALCRAALKKQPRGVFTVTGLRYDDGRADLAMSMEAQFRRSVAEYNAAVFDNGHECRAHNLDIRDFTETGFDLVYIDTPYYSPHSDNDYLRRYHFVEGLATYWADGVMSDTKTRRVPKRDTPFSSARRIIGALDDTFGRFPGSTLLVSYSSNSMPNREDMVELLGRHRPSVEVFEASHKYSFGTHAHKVGENRNDVSEYLFLAKP
ncbi:MAG: DNA adenine methylase [Actinomycetes bacterium]